MPKILTGTRPDHYGWYAEEMGTKDICHQLITDHHSVIGCHPDVVQRAEEGEWQRLHRLIDAGKPELVGVSEDCLVPVIGEQADGQTTGLSIVDPLLNRFWDLVRVPRHYRVVDVEQNCLETAGNKVLGIDQLDSCEELLGLEEASFFCLGHSDTSHHWFSRFSYCCLAA